FYSRRGGVGYAPERHEQAAFSAMHGPDLLYLILPDRPAVDALRRFHLYPLLSHPGGRSEASGMSKRILVIEDTENNRRILNDLLTNAGFEVLEAVDGEKGVAMAAESRPDLILMDIQLPIFDGYEATRRIKANPELRHIPIIAVTSYALSGDDA